MEKKEHQRSFNEKTRFRDHSTMEEADVVARHLTGDECEKRWATRCTQTGDSCRLTVRLSTTVRVLWNFPCSFTGLIRGGSPAMQLSQVAAHQHAFLSPIKNSLCPFICLQRVEREQIRGCKNVVKVCLTTQLVVMDPSHDCNTVASFL